MHRGCIPIVLSLGVTLGCRADVEGQWQGTIGDTSARLSLVQKGSTLEGEACVDEMCEPIQQGAVDERSLLVTFGCRSCTLPRSTLDLVLSRHLEGEQHIRGCSCDTDDCGCRLPARFSRCPGACADLGGGNF